MIINVSFGDIDATIDTDCADAHNPDVALDYLTRCADTVLRIHDNLPDAATTEASDHET